MTPEQKIQWAILAQVAKWEEKPLPEFPCENVDDLYNQLIEEEGQWDAESEVRCGEEETNIPSEYSRHYESKSVAMQFPDKSWVGWTYWYGGGKAGEPSAINWMDDAYEVDCQEEEKVVTVRTFKKCEPTDSPTA